MALTADKIINAQIIKLDKSFFYVISVDNSSIKPEIVKVKRYIDWACSSRWDSYKVGQRVFLFLKKEKNYYYIMSAGGEGEIPIISDSVSIPFDCLAYPDTWEVSGGIRRDSVDKYRCKFGRKVFNGLQVSLQELISSVARLHSFFEIKSQATIDCSTFIEKQKNEAITNNKTDTLFYLLCKDFFGQMEKNCH